MRSRNPFKFGIWVVGVGKRKMMRRMERGREGFWRRMAFSELLPGLYWPMR